MLNPILVTVVHERVPEELRSRVAGVNTAGVLMTTPLGGLAAGFLIEQAGLTAALLTLGGLYFLATLAPAVFPCRREMDSRREVSSSGPSRPRPEPEVTRPRR
ncbi:MFS transporter [Streptomyces sp. NPDC002187]|uniref:MFS transporter n=1 Tax=Streptomyces sp. NPDC002187 TaxID=3364637 RepID=UPI003684D236